MENTIQYIKMETQLDAANANEFKLKCASLLKMEFKALILDFSQTKFIDSAGLGALVGILRSVGQNNPPKRLFLIGLSSQVQQIFEITRLNRVFEIYSDEKSVHATLETNSPIQEN